MTKNKVRRSVAALLCVACVVLLVLGGLNLPKKSNAKGEAILENLRMRMLLNVTGAGVVESYVNIAKQEAQLKHLEGFLAGVKKKLSNEKFVAHAPEAVVAMERKKQSDSEEKIAALKESLAALRNK